MRSIRFRNCFGMIWSVSTSARSSTWTRPDDLRTGSISVASRRASRRRRSPARALEVDLDAARSRSRAATPHCVSGSSRMSSSCASRVETPRDLLRRPRMLALLLGLDQPLDEVLVEHPLGEPADRDVLPVQEEAAGLEQVEHLLVQLALALVGQVMDAEPRDDRVEALARRQRVAPGGRRRDRRRPYSQRSRAAGQALLRPRRTSARRSRPARRSSPGCASITSSAKPPSPAPRSKKRPICRPPRDQEPRMSSSWSSNSGISLRRSSTKPVATVLALPGGAGRARALTCRAPSTPGCRRSGRRSPRRPPSAG